MYACINIKNFFSISKCERLEILKISRSTNISDISFLEKNKNIKALNLPLFKKFKDYTSATKIGKLYK